MKELHIVLIPFMAHGHTIPMLEMANLFHSRGLKTTIIATPYFSAPIHHPIGLSLTPFPPPASSLPPHIASFDQITPDIGIPAFLRATELLQDPIEEILRHLRPDCLISDMFLPWTADSAAKFRIPRLAFYGTSFFSRCLWEQIDFHTPYNNATEEFLVPGLPHQIKFLKSQISPFRLRENGKNCFSEIFDKMNESWEKTYGEVVNSFLDLEYAYSDHYKNMMGRKAWAIGPLLLCNTNSKNQKRGTESAIY